MPLWAKPWLTIPECQRLTGKARSWVVSRMDAGDFASVLDGARKKVLTSSVREWVDRQTAAQRSAAGLDAPEAPRRAA